MKEGKIRSVAGRHPAPGPSLTDTSQGCTNAYWKCGNCSRIVNSQMPPTQCPVCNEVCDFKNITCYTPDCGGPGNIDPRL